MKLQLFDTRLTFLGWLPLPASQPHPPALLIFNGRHFIRQDNLEHYQGTYLEAGTILHSRAERLDESV